MNNQNVVPINPDVVSVEAARGEPIQEIIDLLMDYLALAESGELQALAISGVARRSDGRVHTYWDWEAANHKFTLSGAANVLNVEIANKLIAGRS